MSGFTQETWTVEGQGGITMAGERDTYYIRIGNVRLVAIGGRLDEATAHLIASNPVLYEALEAQETFDNHASDCDRCNNGSHCDVGADLSTKAQNLRAQAFKQARGEE